MQSNYQAPTSAPDALPQGARPVPPSPDPLSRLRHGHLESPRAPLGRPPQRGRWPTSRAALRGPPTRLHDELRHLGCRGACCRGASRDRASRDRAQAARAHAHLKSKRVTQRRRAECNARRLAGIRENEQRKRSATTRSRVPNDTFVHRSTEYATCNRRWLYVRQRTRAPRSQQECIFKTPIVLHTRSHPRWPTPQTRSSRAWSPLPSQYRWNAGIEASSRKPASGMSMCTTYATASAPGIVDLRSVLQCDPPHPQRQ